MNPISHPYLHATFCDDVRHEVTGKMVYVGVYSDSLIASEYPVLLPKMVVVAHYAYPFEDQTGENGSKVQSVSLFLDGDELLALDQSGVATPPPFDEEGRRVHLMTFMMVMTPFQLTRPGRLCVKIKRNDGTELLSNALVCRLPTESERSVP